MSLLGFNPMGNDIYSSNEKNELMANMSPELIFTNIRQQLDDCGGYRSMIRTDFLSRYEDMYQACKKNPVIEMQAIENMRTEIYTLIIDTISSKYGLDVPDDYDDIFSLGRLMYMFFVIQSKDNILTFFTQHINKNKKSICADYEETKKDNNVLASMKKVYKDSKDALIMANIYDIVRNIANSDYSDEFIQKVAKSNSTVINEAMSKLVKNGVIVPGSDFFQNYITSFVTYNQNEFFTELREKLHSTMQLDKKINILE